MKELRVDSATSEVVGVVDVLETWLIAPDRGEQRIAFPEVNAYAGEGFLPNVTVRIDVPDAPTSLPDSGLVVSDRAMPEAGDVVRRVRLVLSDVSDAVLMQMVLTLEAPLGTLSVTCTATDVQWPRLAQAFDDLSASARLEVVAERTASR